MSTVPPPVPPPTTLEPGPPRKGCARNALIGCGGAALLVVLCLVAFMIYIQKRPTAITDFMMKQIESSYAADVTEAEKAELRAAYAEFRQAVDDKRARREPLERVRRIMTFNRTGEVTREQVRELTAVFREAAGSGAPVTPGAAPAEVTETDVTPSPASTPGP
ncbi:MAG: hypothetical protein ABR576_03895 [Thermoanaerobaculia bacterium]